MDALEYTHPHLNALVNRDHFTLLEQEKRKKQEDEEYTPETADMYLDWQCN